MFGVWQWLKSTMIIILFQSVRESSIQLCSLKSHLFRCYTPIHCNGIIKNSHYEKKYFGFLFIHLIKPSVSDGHASSFIFILFTSIPFSMAHFPNSLYTSEHGPSKSLLFPRSCDVDFSILLAFFRFPFANTMQPFRLQYEKVYGCTICLNLAIKHSEKDSKYCKYANNSLFNSSFLFSL